MGRGRKAARRLCPAQFLPSEAGAASVFAMGLLMFTLIIAGFVIDTANIWRNREFLRLAADVASHAGATTLARGGTPEMAVLHAIKAIGQNVPQDYGRIINNARSDIVALHYDQATNSLAADGPVNAVSVRVQRSQRVDNPVPSLVLNMIGIASWDIGATSVAVLIPTRRCSNAEGLFARAPLTLAGQSEIGTAVCLHSQTAVVLEQRTEFAPGSGLSMPDLANCFGKCAGALNPGAAAAAVAVNLVMPDLGDTIDRLSEGFADPHIELSEEATFFAAHPLATELSALQEMMVETDDLETGSPVALTPMEFRKMREFPSGLVYVVSCATDDAGDQSDPMLVIRAADGPSLKGLALVTDCALRFEPGASVEGTLMITTFDATPTALTIDGGAHAGDPDLGCNAAAQTVLMSRGSVQVPPEFLTSNVALVVAGDVVLEAGGNPAPVQHVGTAIHASGTIRVVGPHAFTSCNQLSSPVLPSLQVIRQVLPVAPVVAPDRLLPKAPPPALPGTIVNPLERAPELIGLAPEAEAKGRPSTL